MRKLLLIPALLALAAPSCGVAPPQGEKDKPEQGREFMFKAMVVEAMEGGPVVIRATLCYRGERPIDLHNTRSVSGPVSVSAPANWQVRTRSALVHAMHQATVTIKPGEEWTGTRYLHKHYHSIPAGESKVKVFWRVRDAKPPHPEIACPSTTLVVHVQPATADNLARLSKRLEQRLEQPDFSEMDWWDLLNQLQYTQHPVLGAIACRMIPRCPANYSVDRLVGLCYEMDDPPYRVADAHLAQFVSANPSEHAPVNFRCWRGRGTVLPAAEFQKLARSESVWTRVLTYVTFPGQCDRAWSTALLDELRALSRPAPPAQITPLLRDLDDDAFEVRERASARLEQLGERAVGPLRQALDTPLSPEAKRRVRLILDKIEVSSLPPDCGPALQSRAESGRTPEADAVLGILARGDPTFRVTKEAARALQRAQRPIPPER